MILKGIRILDFIQVSADPTVALMDHAFFEFLQMLQMQRALSEVCDELLIGTCITHPGDLRSQSIS